MRVIVLVGPKGSGKSTIGRLLHRPPRVVFFEVERVARRVLAALGGVIDERYARRAFDEVLRELDALPNDVVVIETTGASAETASFLAALAVGREVRHVKVEADEATCRERIAARDASAHVPVDAELLRELHARSLAVELPWDVVLRNDPPLSEAEVQRRLRPLLSD